MIFSHTNKFNLRYLSCSVDYHRDLGFPPPIRSSVVPAMSVPPEALQKMLLEMDNQLNKSQAELSMVNLQLDKVNTNLAMIDSTKKSLAKYTVPSETVWKGIGKAFVATDVGGYLQEMANDGKQFEETKSGLNKKKAYLETTLTNTINAMSQIVDKK